MKLDFEMYDNFPMPMGYATLIRYYPVRFSVDIDYQENRRIVYAFKEGQSIDGVNQMFVTVIQAIKGNSTSNTFLAVIPASTVLKTHTRYFEFCKKISSLSGVNNGYQLIAPHIDRDEVHIGPERNYNNVISSIKFSPDVRGKHIILIDDVVTTGKSFKMVSKRLIQLGALSVKGIMLAKTHWITDEEIIDDIPF